MVNRNYVNGRAFEYKIVKMMRSKGYVATRTPGSHGVFDVWAFNEEGFVLIQGKKGSSPVSEAMVEIRKVKVPVGTRKQLWVNKGREIEVFDF